MHRCSPVLLLTTGAVHALSLIVLALPGRADAIAPRSSQAIASGALSVLPEIELPPIQPMLPEVAPEVRLVIRLSDRRVYLYHDDEVQTSFPVAVGRAGWETPVGEFAVLDMIENPGWTNPFTGEVVPPGPNNPLGDRWIGFWTDGQNYIGFHGTPNPESVGRAASHGCIRMYNEDVRRLFEMVEVGTRVAVEP